MATDTSSPVPTEFSVSGMTCQNCARHVTEAIQSVDGVASATVQLEAGRANVRWQPNATPDGNAVVRAITAAGFEAKVATANSPLAKVNPWSPLAGWRFNVVIGLSATIPLMLGEWVFQLGMTTWFHWVAFALALPVQIFCGARFYRGAWNQLKVRASNMDTLVALGSTTAFVYSVWGLFAGGHTHLYFMEAASIITLISAGHWMESLVSAKAASSLQALLNLAPPTARQLDAQDRETEVPVASLRVGDRVVLKPGDRVPTDGVITDGNSAVDESMLTGESLPVDKFPGAKVYAGTVNENGRLVLRVAATGEATALASIIAVVQRAQTSRASIQKLGDQVSNVFVPIVVLIAIGTALWWGLAYEHAVSLSKNLEPILWAANLPQTALAAAFIQAAAVLIVSCPCAMGLATPAAIMAGTNAAARRGILIRDGEALEKTGRLTTVVFDKTGTLTQGKVSVEAVEDLRDGAARVVPIEQIASALARPSTHPLSQAVAKLGAISRANTNPSGAAETPIPIATVPPPKTISPFALSSGLNALRREPAVNSPAPRFNLPQISAVDPLAPLDWQELRGSGVLGRLPGDLGEFSGATLRLGSLNWLRECKVDLGASGEFVTRWSGQGATLLGLAANNRLIGLLALRDTIKPHAAEVVARLERQGQKVCLITGDNRLTAMAIAKAVGIASENVFADIRPERKAEIVKELQQRGERVAFVGDGINDAPALEQADLGIAVAQASDVAREAADIILLKSDIQAIPEALGLAQATLRTIKQNLFWAFFYNAAAIPLAALGFLSPVLCAAAMGLSDLVVIGNALRLRKWRE